MSLENVESITNDFICCYPAQGNGPPGYLHMLADLQSRTRWFFRSGLRLYLQSHNFPSLTLFHFFIQDLSLQSYSRFDAKTIVLKAWVQGQPDHLLPLLYRKKIE